MNAFPSLGIAGVLRALVHVVAVVDNPDALARTARIAVGTRVGVVAGVAVLELDVLANAGCLVA